MCPNKTFLEQGVAKHRRNHRTRMIKKSLFYFIFIFLHVFHTEVEKVDIHLFSQMPSNMCKAMPWSPIEKLFPISECLRKIWGNGHVIWIKLTNASWNQPSKNNFIERWTWFLSLWKEKKSKPTQYFISRAFCDNSYWYDVQAPF